MSNVIPFPTPNRALSPSGAASAIVPAGRPGSGQSSNPFDNPILRAIDQLQEAQDQRSRIILQAIFGERM